MDWTPFITAVLRHGLTALAGILLEHGLIMATDQQKFVEIATSIAVGLVSLAWSWGQKRHQQQQVVLAEAGYVISGK